MDIGNFGANGWLAVVVGGWWWTVASSDEELLQAWLAVYLEFIRKRIILEFTEDAATIDMEDAWESTIEDWD